MSALDQSQDIHEHLFFLPSQNARPCAAACLSSYLTYSHSDLKMRLLALQAIKASLHFIFLLPTLPYFDCSLRGAKDGHVNMNFRQSGPHNYGLL